MSKEQRHADLVVRMYNSIIEAAQRDGTSDYQTVVNLAYSLVVYITTLAHPRDMETCAKDIESMGVHWAGVLRGKRIAPVAAAVADEVETAPERTLH